MVYDKAVVRYLRTICVIGRIAYTYDIFYRCYNVSTLSSKVIKWAQHIHLVFIPSPSSGSSPSVDRLLGHKKI